MNKGSDGRVTRKDMEPVVKFPSGFPKMTSGVLLPARRELVTGHEDGTVARWSLGKNEPDIALRAVGKVEALGPTTDGDLFIGSNAGDLFLLRLSSDQGPVRIQEATNSKYDRVWKALSPAPGRVITTSCYGVVRHLRFTAGEWQVTSLKGHSDSVFSVAHAPSSWLATGDYRGRISIWREENADYSLHQRLSMDSYVSGLAFVRPDLLAGIGFGGKVKLFEHRQERNEWFEVFQSETSSGFGTCIGGTLGDSMIMAGTAREVLAVDPRELHVKSAKIQGAVAIFPGQSTSLVLEESGLYRFSNSNFVGTSDLLRYRFVKVALLGHTGFGKSTLSSALATGSPGSQSPTFGRKIWNWVINPGPPEDRVVLCDNGGQELVVPTLLPLVADSDVALYFFKQTDRRGFLTALQIQHRLGPILPSGSKELMIETFTDSDLVEITDEYITKAVGERGLDGWLKVCPTRETDVQRFAGDLKGIIDWGASHAAVQSTALTRLERVIASLRAARKASTTVQEVRSNLEADGEGPVYLEHLRFLLTNLTDTGQVEFYRSIDPDLVVLDDPEFNQLRTKLPVFVGEHHGIIRMSELNAAFPKSPVFLAMLDRFYTASGIALEAADGANRIFPYYLDDRRLNLDPPFDRALSESEEVVQEYAIADFDLGTLIGALIDLKLDCVDATVSEGLFAWATRAALYYKTQVLDDAFGGRRLKLAHRIGGGDAEGVSRLKNRARELFGSLYGNARSEPPVVKKKRPEHPIEVALSYAGEDIDYVKRVNSELLRLGRRVFFDKDRGIELWGEDLILYLRRVFRDQAQFCVMFISKHYVAKTWPKREARAALERQFLEDEPYILPVLLDNSEVDDLPSTIRRESIAENTPEQLAEKIVAKLELAQKLGSA